MTTEFRNAQGFGHSSSEGDRCGTFQGDGELKGATVAGRATSNSATAPDEYVRCRSQENHELPVKGQKGY